MQVGLTLLRCLMLAVLLPYSLIVQAQLVEDEEGDVQDAEIIVEKERQIVLKAEEKLYEYIKWKPAVKGTSQSPYEFNGYPGSLKTDTVVIQPVENTLSDETAIYQHFAKLGFGNYASPLVDLSLNKSMNSRQAIGFNLKHKSFASGRVDGQNSGGAETSAHLFGMSLMEDIKLQTDIIYELNKNFYYGYPSGMEVDRNDIRHKHNFFTLELQLDDNNLSDDWSYTTSIGFGHYSDNFDARENQFNSELDIDFQKEFFLVASFNSASYKDVAIDQNRLFISATPYYHFTISDFNIDLGVSLSFQNDNLPALPSQKVFPYVYAEYPLTMDYSVFARLDGGFNYNALQDMAAINGMLNQSTVLANSERVFEWSGGIMGKPLAYISFQIAAGVQSIRYLPVFVNNITDQSRFDVVYDAGTTEVYSLESKVQYQFNEYNELSLGANIYSYQSERLDQVYHLPTTELTLSGFHQINTKLRSRWHFEYLRGLVGRDENLTDSDVNLDEIFKLDLEFHYQLKEQWGAFISAENLFNKNFSRYLYYPQRGIQFRLGASFRL